MVVEPTTVVATHLIEVLKANAAELLGRQDVQEMVETLKKTHPALVEEVIPTKRSLGTLHRVLQRLLRERVPIRDLVTILEAIGDAAEQTKDPELLCEHARRSLANVIARLYADATGAVQGITMGPRLEQALSGLFSPRQNAQAMGLLTEECNAAGANLTREEQDHFAAQSHQKAARAWKDGVFEDEVVPVEVPQRRGDPVVVTQDEGVRSDTTVESLARLRAAFARTGCRGAGALRGRRSSKRAPWPGGTGSARTSSPPWAEASWRAM